MSADKNKKKQRRKSEKKAPEASPETARQESAVIDDGEPVTDEELYGVKYDLLPRRIERELARRWRNNQDYRARARIIESYQRMAVSYAMRASRGGLPFEDLLQEANFGLIEALNRFEPERGFGFGTFARYHVISKIQIFTLDNAGPVRIFNTATTKTLLSRFNRLRQAIESETGEPLDDKGRDTICEILGTNRNEIADFERATSTAVPVDPGAGQQEDTVAKPLQVSNPEDLPEDQALGKIMNEKLHRILDEAVSMLSDREQTIIRSRLMSDQELTLEDLSKKFGISRERVRQIELRAKREIRRVLKKYGITSADSIF